MKEFKGTKTKKGELKWIRSTMGFQVLTADSYYSICEAVGKKPQEEQTANAQLIAAAPELLEALKTLVELQDHKIKMGKWEGYIEERAKAWHNAEKAINKALGS